MAALPGAQPGWFGIMTVSKPNTNFLQKAFRLERLFVLLILPVLWVSCKNKRAKEEAKTEDNTTVYYPINNYIRQQIKDVDTTPYFLYRLAIINHKKDSSVVDRATFDAKVKTILFPELEDKSFRANFTESVFDDESTNSITLTYSPKNKSGIVQNASVLLDKENQKVKWIFINTVISNNDSTVIQRIGWKGDKSCYINEDITYPNKSETQRQISFVWNDKEE